MRRLSRDTITKLIDSGAVVKLFVSGQCDYVVGQMMEIGKDIRTNFLFTPNYIEPESWKEIVAKTFCEANELDDRRIHNVFASQINILYQLKGVYKTRAKSREINILHVYDKFSERLLKTTYPPSFDESNLITSRLEPLKKPELKMSYCSSSPNDDHIYFSSNVLTIRGQVWSMMLNTWAVLLMINKQFEALGVRKDLPRQLIVVEEVLVNPQVAEGTLKFMDEKGRERGLLVAIMKSTR